MASVQVFEGASSPWPQRSLALVATCEDLVLDLAGGETPGTFDAHVAVGDQVAVLIHSSCREKVVVQQVADETKTPSVLRDLLRPVTVSRVLTPVTAPPLADDLDGDGIPPFRSCRWRRRDPARSCWHALIAAVKDACAAGIARVRERLFRRTVAAADKDILPPEEKAVTGGAVAHALAGEFLLAGNLNGAAGRRC